MKVKSIIAAAIVGLSALTSSAQTSADTPRLFELPSIPDSITDITQRYNYYVSHYWDRANRQSMFSNRKLLAAAFVDYVSPLRYTQRSVVEKSVADLMKSIEKNSENQLYIARLAEDCLYGDSALYLSDELYLDFIRPVVKNKRGPKANKARYELQATQLANSMEGHKMNPIEFTDVNGNRQVWNPGDSIETILFFNDPDCIDCNLARVRLKADPTLNRLIDEGRLQVVALSPVEVEAGWIAQAVDYPKNWKVGANPDLDLTLDLRNGTPDFWVVAKDGTLVRKRILVDQLLNIFSRL